MSGKHFINFILFQVLWLACVWGAAYDLLWPGLVVFSLLVIWQSLPMHRHPADIRLALLCLLLGGALDSIWQATTLLQFKLALSETIAPVWILLLWMGVALTLNHSLHWLKQRYLLAAAFAGIAAPFSYYAAQRMGPFRFMQSKLFSRSSY